MENIPEQKVQHPLRFIILKFDEYLQLELIGQLCGAIDLILLSCVGHLEICFSNEMTRYGIE
jgi:hypothetical protein